jgi:UDP-GlcNAc:undecaprenyl-phosphate GlcNAc-1-phosphate transferase
LAAAIVGFLFYNLPPARIFMGDSGSLFLGFCLAVIPLIGSQTHPRELGVLTAGTIIALPVFDVFAAILRRRRKGLGIMEPDREHLHHKLLDLGFNVRNILAMTYLVGLGLGLAALMAATGDNRQSLLILMAALLALGGLFITLHFAKRKLMKNGMGNGAGDK